MIGLQDIEQLIPFIKPLFDGLRSARDFFKRDTAKDTPHGIKIPKQTLILLPDINPHQLRWGLGKVGDKPAMQITGTLQATNTSPYAIRIGGIKLLEPSGGELVTRMVTVENPETGMHSQRNMIQPGYIGEIAFLFFLTPVIATPGRPLIGALSITDQFGNEHIVRHLQFMFFGPEKLP